VSPWKVILATMVIFACGVFTGVFVTRTEPAAATVAPPQQPMAAAAVSNVPPATAVSTNKGPLPAEFLKRLDQQLELTPEQHEDIVKIMAASRDRTAPLWYAIAPQMSDEMKKVRGEIRKLLTPEQRKKWTEMNKRSNVRPDRPEPAKTPDPGINTN
jgi:Spy/CpxP family protein refolding chaperone